MSLSVTCPDCGSRFPVDDDLEGQRVRCRHCRCPFVVRTPGRRAGERDPDEEDEPGEETPKGSQSIAPVVWVLGIGGAVLLAVVAGCAGMFYYTTHRAGEAADRLVDDVKQQIAALPPGGNPFFVPLPQDLDEAIRDLQGPDRARRLAAAQWVQFQPVQPGRRAQVARGLATLLDDPDLSVRVAGMRALEAWAGAENAPALIRLLESDPTGLDGEECRHLATNTLVRLKDAGGASAIARQWKYPAELGRTRRALEQLGPGAEDAVVPYLNNVDPNVQAEACKTLRVIGTRRSLPALQALLDRVQGRRGLEAVSASAREAVNAVKGRP